MAAKLHNPETRSKSTGYHSTARRLAESLGGKLRRTSPMQAVAALIAVVSGDQTYFAMDFESAFRQ
jgi:hypothetical protein